MNLDSGKKDNQDLTFNAQISFEAKQKESGSMNDLQKNNFKSMNSSNSFDTSNADQTKEPGTKKQYKLEIRNNKNIISANISNPNNSNKNLNFFNNNIAVPSNPSKNPISNQNFSIKRETEENKEKNDNSANDNIINKIKKEESVSQFFN